MRNRIQSPTIAVDVFFIVHIGAALTGLPVGAVVVVVHATIDPHFAPRLQTRRDLQIKTDITI